MPMVVREICPRKLRNRNYCICHYPRSGHCQKRGLWTDGRYSRTSAARFQPFDRPLLTEPGGNTLRLRWLLYG